MGASALDLGRLISSFHGRFFLNKSKVTTGLHSRSGYRRQALTYTATATKAATYGPEKTRNYTTILPLLSIETGCHHYVVYLSR